MLNYDIKRERKYMASVITKQKLKVIILGTGDIALQVFRKLQLDVRIEIVGIICDTAVKEEINKAYMEEIKKNGGKILPFTEQTLKQADIIFACEYRKVISSEYVRKYMFLNCHAGILPKYRGFSANPWAIMNGETQIGYTIHRMDEKLDNGDIFYVGRFTILKEQTYADVYDDIFNDMVIRIADILLGVYEGRIHAHKTEKKGVYCSRFNSEMGNLGDFDTTSEYILNLYRCMARPHGTGIYFYFKKKKYYIGKVISGRDLHLEDYMGITGKIVNIEGQSIWVKTRDNVVVLSNISNENGNIVDIHDFTIGNKLGK